MLKKLISKFTTKAARAFGILPGWMGRIPVWSERDFSSFAREGYKQVVWVYACINEISSAVAGVPWKVVQVPKGSKGKKTVLENHPLAMLLSRPNQFMSNYGLMERYAGFLAIAGNAYWELAEMDILGRPKELYPIRPDRVRVVPSATDYVAGYIYNINGMDIPFERNEIIHHFFPDYLDDYYGMSPMEAAARTIDVENEAVAWNKVFFQNAARPDGGLATEQILNEHQFRRLKAEIDENYKGTKNAHRPMLLEAGLKWQQFGLSQKDMEFVQLRKMDRVEICGVYGVPPELVGDKEHATYSNYKEARKSFYEETIIPRYLDRCEDQINLDLAPRYDDRIRVEYDLTNVAALQENFKDQVGTAYQLWQMGWPINQINERLELGFEKVPWGDAWWAPLSVLPVTGAEPPEPAPEPEPPEPEPPEPPAGKSYKVVNLVTEEQKSAYWKAFDRQRLGWEKKMTTKVREQFKKELGQVLKAFNANPDQGDFEKALDRLVKKWRKPWEDMHKAFDMAVAEQFGQQTMDSLANQVGKARKAWVFDPWWKGFQDWVNENTAQKVTGILQTTMDLIKNAVSTGYDEGEDTVTIAKRIEDLYEGFSRSRAITIARTEIVAASNSGSQFGAKQTGLDYEREWLSSRDERVREDHKDADGQTVGKEAPYKVGGAKLMFPGDSSLGAPAKQIVHCRCAEAYKVRR